MDTSKYTLYYPNELLSNNSIVKGGFIIYGIGMFYMFIGIYIVNYFYMEPSITKIKNSKAVLLISLQEE